MISNAREVLESIEKALNMVADLCEGKRRWIMSIPAQPDSDPDLVIAHALSDARDLLRAQLEGEPTDPEAINSYERTILSQREEIFALREQLVQAYSRTLEEAAQICDTFQLPGDYVTVAKQCAEAIRAIAKGISK